MASPVAQTEKNLPAVPETQVQCLGWEDPLEEGMATHSSIFAWMIPMDRRPWYATVHGVAKSQTRLSDLAAVAAAMEMQTYRTDLWTQCGKERVGQIERATWKHIHYHI